MSEFATNKVYVPQDYPLYWMLAVVRKTQSNIISGLDRNLTITQLRILFQLGSTDWVGIRQLSEQALVEASALSHVIKKFSNEGIISRRPVDGDRRMIEVRLTKKGRKLFEQCSQSAFKAVEITFKDFTGEEMQTTFRLLNKMKRNVGIV